MTKYEQAIYLCETNGSCLENYDKDAFFLCKNCICGHICTIRFEQRLDYHEQRLRFGKKILREEKLKRILK